MTKTLDTQPEPAHLQPMQLQREDGSTVTGFTAAEVLGKGALTQQEIADDAAREDVYSYVEAGGVVGPDHSATQALENTRPAGAPTDNTRFTPSNPR